MRDKLNIVAATAQRQVDLATIKPGGIIDITNRTLIFPSGKTIDMRSADYDDIWNALVKAVLRRYRR